MFIILCSILGPAQMRPYLSSAADARLSIRARKTEAYRTLTSQAKRFGIYPAFCTILILEELA